MITDVLQFDKITILVGNVYQEPETTCETLLGTLIADRFMEKQSRSKFELPKAI